MGNFGFSYIGLIWLIMLFVPNIIWTKSKPLNYDFKNENRVLLILERAGQGLVTCQALVFSNFNFHSLRPWSLWLLASFILMVLYEAWWIKYFKSPKTLEDFYSSLLGIPVAGAVLPTAAFLLLGIYGKVFLMILSAVILGIGHIGIHVNHLKELRFK